MNQKKQRTLAIFVLAIALVATTIAYAVLSTTLSISGNVTKKGGSWDVHLANVSQATTTGTGKMTTTPQISGTTLSFAAELSKPGDSVEFTFDIVNGGTINAIMYTGSLSLNNKSESIASYSGFSVTNNNITYKIYMKDDLGNWESAGTNLFSCCNSYGDGYLALGKQETKNVKIVLTYNSSATSVDSTDKTMNVTASFPFVQA